MKKAIYEAPQIDILRFETEEVLNTLLPSGNGNAPEIGGITFGSGTDLIDLF